jgi:hypothetical protein
MPVIPPPRVCPFCGLATEVPHETQAGCIEALQAEIDRMRGVLKSVKDPLAQPLPDDDTEVV